MQTKTYLVDTKGEHFALARQDLVTLLIDFREQLAAAGISPNITDVFDSHTIRGTAHPYATVGLVNVGMGDPYLSRSSSAFEIALKIEMQIFIHTNPLDGLFDEREKWYLLNSLFNYLKDLTTISTNFDAMSIMRMQGGVTFGVTNTAGAVIDLTITKVATR